MTNEYDIGDLVRSSAPFTDEDGAAADPTTVTVKYRLGTGAITTLVYGEDGALVKDSTGNYHVDIEATVKGILYVYWLGEGTVQAADSDFWVVKPSRVV